MIKLSHIYQKNSGQPWRLYEHQNLMLIISGLLAVLVFIVVQPRISSTVVPGVRAQRISSFLNESQTTQSVDPWGLWQLRDQLDFGVISLMSQDTTASLSADIINLSELARVSAHFLPWSVFRSNRSLAVEGLVSASAESVVNDVVTIPADRLILDTPSAVILQSDDGTVSIMTLLPIDTMAKVNGYLHFAYRDKRFQKDTLDRKWLTITQLQP